MIKDLNKDALIFGFKLMSASKIDEIGGQLYTFTPYPSHLGAATVRSLHPEHPTFLPWTS